MANVNQAALGSRAIPNQFCGEISANANLWWTKFHAFCERNAIPNVQRVYEFNLLISGSCENWFAMLPADQKDTYEHLRAAFIAEYANANGNIVESELFYHRKQSNNEPAVTFIDNMLKLGNKLQLANDEILRTIKRGLVPDLYMFLMDKDIPNISVLKQKCQLREIMNTYLDLPQNASKTVQNAIVKSDNAEILQSSIDKLTNSIDKLQLASFNSNQQQQLQISSPALYAYSNNMQIANDILQQQSQNQSNAPYCTKCMCVGHFAHQCALQQNQLPSIQCEPKQPNYGYRDNRNYGYQSQFNGQNQNFRQNNGCNSNYRGFAPRNVYFGQRYGNNANQNGSQYYNNQNQPNGYENQNLN
jgi:hypothetical protein